MTEAPPKKRNACVIVLGDIGRSPRMQYHAQSLLEENYHVDVIGYLETRPLEALTQHPCCRIHALTAVPSHRPAPKARAVLEAV